MRSAFLVFFLHRDDKVHKWNCFSILYYYRYYYVVIKRNLLHELNKGQNNVSCRYSRDAIFAYLVCSARLLYSECPTIRNDALESSRIRSLGLHLSVLSLYVRTSSPSSSNLSSYVTELVFPLITLANTINITNNGDTTEAFYCLESVVFSSK